jgi:single-strand DNA-binding protein
MRTKTDSKKKQRDQSELEEDYSLNDVVLRGRVSREAIEKELPSGDKVVEFRVIALTLKAEEWVEVSGSIHRRFWSAPTGLASRWQVEAVEISRI